jgi:hypothetical protein
MALVQLNESPPHTAKLPALVIEVPAAAGGYATVSMPAGPTAFRPADLSRVRAALLEAQAVALQDRGTW